MKHAPLQLKNENESAANTDNEKQRAETVAILRSINATESIEHHQEKTVEKRNS